MRHSLGHHHALAPSQLAHLLLQVPPQPPADHVEELGILLVLVPVLLPFDHPQADDSVVYPAEGLVLPPIGTGGNECGHIHPLQWPELDVQVGHIGIRRCFGLLRHSLSRLSRHPGSEPDTRF